MLTFNTEQHFFGIGELFYSLISNKFHEKFANRHFKKLKGKL
jgi:hypothetical protein